MAVVLTERAAKEVQRAKADQNANESHHLRIAVAAGVLDTAP